MWGKDTEAEGGEMKEAVTACSSIIWNTCGLTEPKEGECGREK